MTRKLASVQKIAEIRPIDGYDRVELATVLGWTLIVSKGEFSVGDLCVYFEPDSQLYPHEIWDTFLAKRNYRIKTIKMCGVVSQGLALPINIINKLTKSNLAISIDMDLTELLNVKHYEKAVEDIIVDKTSTNFLHRYLMRYKHYRILYAYMFGGKPSGFPSNIVSRTDETNIQSTPQTIKKLMGSEVYISEKLEGQSATYIYRQKDGFINKLFGVKEFIVCSHNRRLPKEDQSNWWRVARKYNIKYKLKEWYKITGNHVAIQGEIVGPKIQKNIYKLNDLELYLFNGFNVDNNIKMKLFDLEHFCWTTGLNLVPIVGNITINDTMDSNYFLELSNGFSEINKNTRREGVVVRTKDMGVSFKARSPLYLLGE